MLNELNALNKLHEWKNRMMKDWKREPLQFEGEARFMTQSNE